MVTRSPDVDAHIAAAAEPFRAPLQHLRELIWAAAPDSVEVIAYGVPTFKVGGHNLVHFAAARQHCSFYPGSEAIEVHAAELAGFSTARGTIRFTPDRQIPDALVTAIVGERLADVVKKRPR